MSMKIAIAGFLGLVVLSFTSCTKSTQKVTFQGETQGTYYAVTYFDAEGRDFQPQVDSILHAFDQSVSMWVPESIISRINRDDSLASPDAWFEDIFRLSEEVSNATGGAFDFTIGPLVNAWGFGFKGKMNMDSSLVDSLKQLVDYRMVRLEDGKIIRKKDNIQFDFNAIAQGYAVDIVGDFLASKGVTRFLVDIGGEILGKGTKPDGHAWLVGIENPAADSLAERTLNARVKLTDRGLATSGNYRKYYEENGIRYSHTIDPKTGYPVRHSLLSVSVLADDCATADGFATAFMVMGFEKARAFVENKRGMEAYFIMDAGSGIFQTYATEGFEEIMVESD
jgi:thiamine biosynthesis lipoprotein